MIDSPAIQIARSEDIYALRRFYRRRRRNRLYALRTLPWIAICAALLWWVVR